MSSSNSNLSSAFTVEITTIDYLGEDDVTRCTLLLIVINLPAWRYVIRMHWYSLSATEPPQSSSHDNKKPVVQKSICSRVHSLCFSGLDWDILRPSPSQAIKYVAKPPRQIWEVNILFDRTGRGNYCNLPTSEYEGQVDRAAHCTSRALLIKSCTV